MRNGFAFKNLLTDRAAAPISPESWAFCRIRHKGSTPLEQILLFDKKSGMMLERIRGVVSEGTWRMLLISAGALGLLCASGCASGNYQKADAAGESLRR